MSRRSLSVREKEIIIGFYMENNSLSETARAVRISASVVGGVIKRYNDKNSLLNKPKTGRPVKTTMREDRAIVKLATKDRFLSSRRIANQFNMESDTTSISYKTVIRRLGKVGLTSRVAARKPLISLKNRRKLLDSQNNIKCRLNHDGTTFSSVTSLSTTSLEMMGKTVSGEDPVKDWQLTARKKRLNLGVEASWFGA